MRLSPSLLCVLPAHRSPAQHGAGRPHRPKAGPAVPAAPGVHARLGTHRWPQTKCRRSREAAAHSPCPVRKERGAQSSSQRLQVAAWCRLCPVVPGLSFAFVPSSTGRTQDAPSRTSQAVPRAEHLAGASLWGHARGTRRLLQGGSSPQSPLGLCPLVPEPHTRQPVASSSSSLCPLSAPHPSFPEQGLLPPPEEPVLKHLRGAAFLGSEPAPHGGWPTGPPGLPSPQNRLLCLDFGLPLPRGGQAPDFW